MRWFAVVPFALALFAIPLRADVRFVTPQQGAQVYGAALIEIATTTPNVDRVEFFVDGTLAGVTRTAPFRIIYDFGDSTSSHRIAAHLYSDRYRSKETAEILTAALTAGETIDVDLVEVPFRAVTRTVRLGKSDITVRENGVEQTVRELLTARGATTFYFVIDRSASMRRGKVEKAIRAVERALTRLRPGDDAKLIYFNHRVEAQRTVVAGEKLRAVTPSGGTSLRDALASIQPARRTIAIVISDGADRNSSSGTAAALQRVARSKLTVYSLVLGGGSGAEFLETAARRTGGTSARSTAETLSRDLESIMNDINSRYTLVYQSRGTSKGWREIQLTPRRSGIQIAQARRGYFAE